MQDSGLYLKELIEPVLTCFNDADSRLRYYACEALYNIVKVARGAVLPHFNVLFDGLSKVTTPPAAGPPGPHTLSPRYRHHRYIHWSVQSHCHFLSWPCIDF